MTSVDRLIEFGNRTKKQVFRCLDCPFRGKYDQYTSYCKKSGKAMRAPRGTAKLEKSYYGRIININLNTEVPDWCPFPKVKV